MADMFGGLDKAFGDEPSELQKHVESVKTELKKSETPDVKHDYEVARAQMHNLVSKGQEAVDGILEVAQSSDHPRAYEVAALMIKNVADTTEKLIDLQRKMKELDAEDKKVTNNTTNAMFVGSTSDLQKMLKNINKSEETT
tara:strand:+ start:800 stop:1222 length:423 start_codon:yes stop_codon:yes gene_type:complete